MHILSIQLVSCNRDFVSWNFFNVLRKLLRIPLFGKWKKYYYELVSRNIQNRQICGEFYDTVNFFTNNDIYLMCNLY